MKLPSNLSRLTSPLFETPAGQLFSLDLLRVGAIGAVFAVHFSDAMSASLGHVPGAWWTHRLVSLGWVGVDLFFVLSGFLIGRQLWLEAEEYGRIDYPAFFVRRAFRIWPLYMLFALASPITTATGSYRIGDWLFLSNYIGGRVEGGWSLSTEEQFYIVAPFLIWGLVRFVRRELWILALAIATGAVAAARHAELQALLSTGLDRAAIKPMLHYPIHLHSEGLLVGLAIAQYATERNQWVGGGITQWRPLGCAMVMLLTGAGLYALDDVIFVFGALGLFFGAILVLALAASPNLSSPAWLRNCVAFLAKLSFGLYLNHFGILRWLIDPLHAALQRSSASDSTIAGVSLVVTALVSIVVASLLFLTIEHPFLKWRGPVLRALSARRARAAAVGG